MDHERRLDDGGVGSLKRDQFLRKIDEQGVGVLRPAHAHTHAPLRVGRARERAQIQSDHGTLQPLHDRFDHQQVGCTFAVGRGRDHRRRRSAHALRFARYENCGP